MQLSLRLQCEDEMVQAMALSVMPIEELQAEAAEAVEVSSAMGEDPVVATQDALAEALLSWFKLHFFSWVCCLAVWHAQLCAPNAVHWSVYQGCDAPCISSATVFQ